MDDRWCTTTLTLNGMCFVVPRRTPRGRSPRSLRFADARALELRKLLVLLEEHGVPQPAFRTLARHDVTTHALLLEMSDDDMREIGPILCPRTLQYDMRAV